MGTKQSWIRAKKLANLTNAPLTETRNYLSKNPDKAKMMDLQSTKVAAEFLGTTPEEIKELNTPEEITIEGYQIPIVKEYLTLVKKHGIITSKEIIDLLEKIGFGTIEDLEKGADVSILPKDQIEEYA